MNDMLFSLKVRLHLTRKQWLALLSLLSIQVLAAFYLQGMAILAPAFALTYHLNVLQMSTLISAKALGSVLGGLAIGVGLDRFGGRRIAWIGLFSTLILFAIAGGMVNHYPDLLLSMLLLGMVLPIFSVVGLYAITHDFPPQYAGMLLGFRQGVIPLGGIMAGALFPMLIAVGLFTVIGGLGFLIFLLTVLLTLALWQLPDHPVDASQKCPAHPSFLRTLLPIGLVVFLLGAGQFSVLVFGLLYLGKLGIHAMWVGGAVMALFLSGGFAARVIAGFLVGHHISLKTLFIIIMLIGTLSMAAWGTMPFHPTLWMILGFSFSLGVGVVGYNALPFQLASELVTHEQKGRAMGLVSAISGLAVALWLPLFGDMVDLWGYSAMWYLVAVLYATATIVVLLLYPDSSCQQPEGCSDCAT
ncbi:MAG: MFS transporter [Gammaproteobacteria bacterium]|nr:MFS transporter [Gammaproteobacteria bacterium]